MNPLLNYLNIFNKFNEIRSFPINHPRHSTIIALKGFEIILWWRKA